MKRYTINCHYDMVISVDVIADNEQQAIERAREQADRMSLNSCAECVGHSECVTDTEELTAGELRRMQAPCIIDYVHMYCDELTGYDGDREQRRENARELAKIAYHGQGINWLEGCDVSNEEWQERLFQDISDFKGINADGLCDRYARMYARAAFERRYKNVAKSLYEANVNGCDKLEKKQAVIDGVRCLCDKMEEYVTRQDEPDYKGWEPQMVIRYESETGDTENYWNLFVYCTGPNDGYGDDYLSLSTSWQHVWTDKDGKDATDDYGSEEHETRAALLRYLFYGDAQEFDETDETVIWQRMTDVWVD